MADKKLDEIKDLARKGDKNAQYTLAKLYKEGKKINKDLNKYKNWLEEAAKNGSSDAMCELGDCYSNGLAVEKDEKTALTWYENAIKKDNIKAKYRMSIILISGLSYILDENEKENDLILAESYLRSASLSGMPDAQYQLGLLYKTGLGGIKKDFEESERWLLKSAESEHLDAQNELGYLYAYGSPDSKVSKNQEKAMKWWGAAAAKSHPEAQYNLAVSFASEAIKNWTLASKSGNEKAKYMLERIKSYQWDEIDTE